MIRISELKTWQKGLALFALALVLIASGYGAGRLHAPAKVITQTKTVTQTVTVQDTQAQVKVQELTAKLEELQKHVTTKIVTVTKPDGTKYREATKQVDVERATDTKVDLSSSLSQTTHGQVDTTATVQTSHVETSSKPDWRIGALIGANVNGLLTNPTGSLVYGAQVERRIVGPFSVGLWGLSSGQGGASVSVEF